MNGGYGFGIENFQEALRQAEAAGRTVVPGDPDTLLIDLDLFRQAKLNDQMLEQIEVFFGEYERAEWKSKSGGTHITLRFPGQTFTPTEAMLLEVALGSDPMRAVLGLMDIRHGVENPRTLFRPGNAEIDQVRPYTSMLGDLDQAF